MVICCTGYVSCSGERIAHCSRALFFVAPYHLYQGFGGFLANAAMGLLFGRLFQHKGRLVRLVLAHSLIDAGAFVGYVMLHGHVSWLP